MKRFMIDVIQRDTEIEVVFNCSHKQVPNQMVDMRGFKELTNITDKQFSVLFEPIDRKVRNNDTIATVTRIKDLLKKDSSVNRTPAEYYDELISLLLSVGNIYSSFIEMMLAHMFVTDIENHKFWRYNQQDDIVLKLSDRTMAAFISPLLGLLYQPNKQSIEDINLDKMEVLLDTAEKIESNSLSIHERIFLELL